MSWVITGSEKTPVDPQFTSVSLLLHGNGANGSTTITDSSRIPKTVTAFGNAQISTAQSKFGGSSIAFDGAGDYLQASASDNFAFNAQDFTVEFWLYWLGATANPQYFIDCRDANFGFFWLYGVVSSNNGTANYSHTSTVAQWQHWAVSRQTGTLRIFRDGVLAFSGADSSNYTGKNLFVGARFNAIETLNGYIDDLRITKGIARYTANFTPPTAPFPDI